MIPEWSQNDLRSANLSLGFRIHVGTWENEDANKGKWRVKVGDRTAWLDSNHSIEDAKQLGLSMLGDQIAAALDNLRDGKIADKGYMARHAFYGGNPPLDDAIKAHILKQRQNQHDALTFPPDFKTLEWTGATLKEYIEGALDMSPETWQPFIVWD